jgi:hypothetical protein
LYLGAGRQGRVGLSIFLFCLLSQLPFSSPFVVFSDIGSLAPVSFLLLLTWDYCFVAWGLQEGKSASGLYTTWLLVLVSWGYYHCAGRCNLIVLDSSNLCISTCWCLRDTQRR